MKRFALGSVMVVAVLAIAAVGTAGVAYAQLRRKVRQFAQIDMAGMESAALRATLTALTEEVGSTQGEALAIPSAAYRAAMKSIESGSADYTDQELDAATGRVGAQSST